MAYDFPTPSTADVPDSRKRPKLSVVFSFFNEEKVLPELLKRTRDVLKAEWGKGHLRDYEMIFVNDASTDRSRELLAAEAAKEGDIVLLNMSRNFGVSTCVLAGMEHATGDAVVYMDADLQDPPEVIPQMLDVYRQRPTVEVVHTVRLSRAGESSVKLLITRLGYMILRHFATIELQIEAGDFKLLSRRALNQLVALKEKRPYLRGLVSWIGFEHATVKYNREARYAGETHFYIFGPRVISNFFSSALVSFSDLPLQVSSFMGVAVSMMAFCYALVLLIENLRGIETSAISYLALAIMFIGGVQLLTIGILGLYISAIHLESKGRPNYILESKVGPGKGAPALNQGNP